MEAAVIPVVEEECQKLIQLSFAKIVNCKQQRGGARLHRSLMVLRVLQKAKDEQRNKSYSESDIMEALVDPTEDVDEEEEDSEDCFGKCMDLDRCRSQSAQAIYAPSSPPISPPPDLHELESFENVGDQPVYETLNLLDSSKVEVHALDSSMAMWRVLSSANSVNAATDSEEYSYSADAYCANGSLWPYQPIDSSVHSVPSYLTAFSDTNSASDSQLDSDHENNNNLNLCSSNQLQQQGPVVISSHESFREPPSQCALFSPMKRKASSSCSSYGYDSSGDDLDQNDSGVGGSYHVMQLCSSPKRVCQASAYSNSGLSPSCQVLKDQNGLGLASSAMDVSQNMTDLIYVFNSSLNTVAVNPHHPQVASECGGQSSRCPSSSRSLLDDSETDSEANSSTLSADSCSTLLSTLPQQQRHCVELACLS